MYTLPMKGFVPIKNVGKESSDAFSRRLRKLDFEDPKQHRVNGVKTYVWPNVKLIDWKKVEDEDQEVLDL